MTETRVNIMGKAKRGDIAVITVTRRDHIIGQEVTPRTEVYVTLVTSVTKGGVVKAVRPAGRGEASVSIDRFRYAPDRLVVQLVSKDAVFVPSIMDLAGERTWPGHPDGMKGRPFDTIDEVRTLCRENAR